MGAARIVLLWLFAAAASYCDIRYRRVPNRLVLAAAAAGFFLAACGGMCSLRSGLGGMLLGFALLFPAFMLHMVGGGDVKSLAVIGLIAGPGLLWVSFLCGAAAAGLAAAALLAARRSTEPGTRRRTLPYAGILSLAAALTALLA